jgi:hypothetical protein
MSRPKLDYFARKSGKSKGGKESRKGGKGNYSCSDGEYCNLKENRLQ